MSKDQSGLPWTGERYVPEAEGQIALEHLHRYAVACELAPEKVVLDIACGEGYGAAMLAEVANAVIGVDNSDFVIGHAIRKYRRSNLEFKIGSCGKIPLPDDCVDFVVSFETIEHHDQHEEMLSEIKRVLKPAGLLLISSPNKYEYSVVPNYSNPFHVKELDRYEFEYLMTRFYKHVAFYGQRIVYGSGILSENHWGSAVTFEKESSSHSRFPGMSRPQYFLALAGDEQLPKFPSSFLEQPVDQSDIVSMWEKLVADRDGQIGGLQTDLEARQQDIATQHKEIVGLQIDLGERNTEIVNLQNDLGERKTQIVNLQNDLGERKTQIVNLQNDLSARQNEIVDLKGNMIGQQKEIANLENVLLARDDQIFGLQRTLVTRNEELEVARGLYNQVHEQYIERSKWAISLDRELTELYNSPRWRLMHPFSTVRQSIKRLSLESPFCRNVLGGFSQRVYRSLSLSRRSRIKTLFHRTEVGGKLFRWLKLLSQVFPSQPKAILPMGKGTIPVDGLDELHFYSEDSPVVSIVIPVHGKIEFTLGCLKAIQASSPKKSFEIIVVDDKSEDQTASTLGTLRGIRVITNEKNLGFIKACNRGAEVAKGEFLVFLNNDTQVLPNWLDELVETFRLVPDAGLVGAKLIYPDGTLQEAGGIVWNDASAWNYGRGDDPRKPEYNYLREVDYCSGACIMVPKELFSRLGGFDEWYAPAYGEDSDLAFRIKKVGRKVLYQPMAEVIHFEGVSSGTDLAQGIKSFQVTNGQKFLERWHSALSSHGSPGSKPQFECERHFRKRILVVDSCTPTPDQDSGSLKIFNFIQIFQALSYKVTFIPDNLVFIEKYTPALQRIGVECLFWSYIESLDSYLATYGRDFDYILSCRPNETEKHLRSYKKHCPEAKILYDTADLHFIREQRQAEVEGDPHLIKNAEKREKQELALVTKVDYTIVVSEAERQILLQKVPGARVGVISAVHDVVETSPSLASREGIFFLGGYQHPPNVDAVQHFVKDIYPLLRERLPAIRFYIIGSRIPESLRNLACEDIVITGYVPDLSDYLRGLRVAVNPLRYGAGVKGKVVTSMANGVPCVGTSLAFEGMDLEHEKDVLVGDTPLEFAEAVVRLYYDENLWNKFSERGVEIVKQKYSFEYAKRGFEGIFSELSSLKSVSQLQQEE